MDIDLSTKGVCIMRNSMKLGKYVKEHVIWSLLVFLWFKNVLFRCIPHCTYTESLVGFLIISVCVVAAGVAISWKRNRNYMNLIENILISWGVFVCITYMELYKERITYMLFAMVVVSLVLSSILLFRRIGRKDKRRKIMARRMENVIVLWKRNAAIVSLLIMAPVAVSSLLYGTVLNSKAEVVKVYGDEHSLKANIEIIADIEPSRWEKLTIHQKLLVAQKIVNAEARFYGLSHEILVGIDDLSEETLAYYRDSTHQIVIDKKFLQNAYSYYLLESLLHEVHHAYAFAQIECYQNLDAEDRNLLMFYEASVYMEEFANYEDGDENFYAYYTQLAEIHAREAGETESLEYIEAINEYLGIEIGVDMDEFSCLQEYIDYISKE